MTDFTEEFPSVALLLLFASHLPKMVPDTDKICFWKKKKLRPNVLFEVFAAIADIPQTLDVLV